MTTPNAKPRAGEHTADVLRCAYDDCAEAHPLANEDTYEQVTCPTCRTELGLPPAEIYEEGVVVRAIEPSLERDIAGLSTIISTDNDGAFWGDYPGDHLGNVAGYIGRIESQLDDARYRQRELLETLEDLVKRCDGAEGVRADGSNIQTMRASALLAKHGR